MIFVPSSFKNVRTKFKATRSSSYVKRRPLQIRAIDTALMVLASFSRRFKELMNSNSKFLGDFNRSFLRKKGAVWIALVGLFVYVDIKYRDFSTLEGTFITPTFRVGVMKVPSVSLISPYFMVKIRFCHFLQGFMYAGS